MCRRNNEYPIPASHLYFRMSEIAGRWCSREGSPEVRIYHNVARRAGGYHVAFAYDAKTGLRRCNDWNATIPNRRSFYSTMCFSTGPYDRVTRSS